MTKQYSFPLDAKILITGGTGFVGSHLVVYLSKKGYSNIHVTQLSGEVPPHILEIISKDRCHTLDLCQQDTVSELLRILQPEVIIQLASMSSVGKSMLNAQSTLLHNITLHNSVLEAMRMYAPQARMLAISSAEVYGKAEVQDQPLLETQPFQPLNPYAVSKVTQDMLSYMYSQMYNLDIVRVRPFNHTGPGQSDVFVVPSFAKQIVAIEKGAQDVLRVGNLEAVRDFSDVQDIIAGYLILITHGKTGEVYNIGSGVGVSIKRVLDELIAISGTNIKVVLDRERLRPSDIPQMVANTTKIQSLGWQPTIPLHTTLASVLGYWRKHI